MTRIAILNVKYSPNLGDGVIAECLEHELSQIDNAWEVQSVDLAGREHFGHGLDAGRNMVLKVLDALPPLVRRIGISLALNALVTFRYRPAWRRKLAGSDCVIVGGGQLIADTDLNFPIKLDGALTEVARLNRPIAVFGVGVSRGMSQPAKRLFERSLRRSRIVHVAVRDNASRENWNAQLATAHVPGASLCRDPGLLAGEVYPQEFPDEARVRPLVGIGIVNSRTLQRHAVDGASVGGERLCDAWVQLARELLARGFDVSLFTNGPHDDEEILDLVLSAIDDPRVQRAARPHRPAELAAMIRSFDAVISHRLHANILAYAFRIPHVGCAWDPKVDAFFRSVGRDGFVAELGRAEPAEICTLLEKALAQGIDPETHAKVVAETKLAVGACAGAMAASLGRLSQAAAIRGLEFGRDATCP